MERRVVVGQYPGSPQQALSRDGNPAHCRKWQGPLRCRRAIERCLPEAAISLGVLGVAMDFSRPVSRKSMRRQDQRYERRRRYERSGASKPECGWRGARSHCCLIKQPDAAEAINGNLQVCIATLVDDHPSKYTPQGGGSGLWARHIRLSVNRRLDAVSTSTTGSQCRRRSRLPHAPQQYKKKLRGSSGHNQVQELSVHNGC